ncbi:MAG: antitermination protein NusG [Gammaproteobacteria bacterium]|nr:antitermination protein NusG [Gammaproteobacteria bacterium]MYF37222.1 antitermination protein NusG [Gammaproteobacteria bacterium]
MEFDFAIIDYFARTAHIVFGIAWIGLLYYFNFVQGGYLAKASDEAKISAFTGLVPSALWWFRWAALFTLLTGLYLVHSVWSNGTFTEDTLIAALMATLMAANVWFIIWPNQKIVIKSNESVRDGGEADPNQGSAAASALLASRTNTLFSFPMVATMVSSGHVKFGGVIESTSYGMFILLALILIIELNAIFGKMNPLIKSVRGVIMSGVALTAITLLLLNFL